MGPGVAPGANALRQALKAWEKSFAAANDGRKPGRDDIKNDASISAKYREYDLLRKKASSKSTMETPRKKVRVHPDSAQKQTILRERSGNTSSATPQRATEAKTLKVIEEEQPPEPTPAYIRCALGPTPQKDGQVLGIFDMLSSGTPSKLSLFPDASESGQIAGTPSKSAVATGPPSSEPCLSRTPQSSSKRRYLEAFESTPIKRRRTENAPTPSSTRKLFATPSFLRRSFPLAPITEDEASATGMGPPLKKRGLFRSLSSMIQGLRKDEEKRMDDEWDILNELEAEEMGETLRPEKPKVLVEDSQAVEMPLGPDEAPLDGDEDSANEEEALDASGRPRKVWKKKGLKRQTRRTNMRPVLHKAKKAADVQEHEGAGLGTEDVVLESQVANVVSRPTKQSQGADAEELDDGEDEDLDSEFDSEEKEKPTAGGQKPSKQAASPSKLKDKKKKMMAATAHANFRTLKIKNKNSKAKGRGGRFGRR